ncbi:tol protein-like protein [Colletotrichum karsti]|uniref:Tol protein-like protein n=1 Tax=Colletotrichum karsti TaxID=1095194 RepID=A0A9P6LJY6_9PEZI|nr:tol protein-like protein [Colletotrichum karsti]KAF9875072.1 tol protein-like protein [Colletotrichum karsti]
MASSNMLCEYCSLIDFSYLRNPTAAEIKSLNAGERPTEDRFPLKFGQPIDGDPSWTLGRTSRIHTSVATCAFCEAITEVLSQYEDELRKLADAGLEDPLCYATCDIAGALQPPQGTVWEGAQPGEKHPEFIMRRLAICFIPVSQGNMGGLKPGRVGFKENSWKRIFHCFQTYDAERQPASSNVENFFGKVHDEPGDVLFAGRKRPGMVDTSLPIQWVKYCRENHTTSCGSAQDRHQHKSSSMPVFRLIDVHKMAVVEKKNVQLKNLNYMALSYVWGSKEHQGIMLEEENYNNLLKDGALRGQVSQTIQDACHFTTAMGTQYIWVDALCIIQNSK